MGHGRAPRPRTYNPQSVPGEPENQSKFLLSFGFYSHPRLTPIGPFCMMAHQNTHFSSVKCVFPGSQNFHKPHRRKTRFSESAILQLENTHFRCARATAAAACWQSNKQASKHLSRRCLRPPGSLPGGSPRCHLGAIWAAKMCDFTAIL